MISLATRVLGRNLICHDEIDSTNAAALALAQEDAPDGTVVLADRQTAGRGRLGREWFSPPGKNLYCSVLLRRLPPAERLPWIPLIAAVAAARAIERIAGLQPSVKWPNDIFLNDRKLGGVLCESGQLGTDRAFVVAGIGLNINAAEDDFPAALRPIATSLVIAQGRPSDRLAVLAELLLDLEQQWDALLTADGHQSHQSMEAYRARCATVGRRVHVELHAGGSVLGRATAINADGSLRVEPPGRPAIDIRAGDVVHLR